MLALAAILLAGGWLRFSNVNWDQGHHLHPDERFLTMVSTALQLPAGVAQYFDTPTSTLNPYIRGYTSFIYGTFPLYLVRALAEPLHSQGYDRINLLGRTVAAAHDLGAVLLVFMIGSFLYGRRVALLAALLLAFVPLHIQQAHFFTVDSYLAFYLALGFYAALRAFRSGKVGWYVLSGAAVGLATASKINAPLIGVVFVVAIAFEWLRKRFRDEPPRPGVSVLAGSIVAGIVTLVFFRLAQPNAFTGPGPLDVLPNPMWLNDLTSWQRIASGEGDYPPSHQWAFTTPYLFPLRHLLIWGLGLPLGLAAVFGVVLSAVQVARDWSKYEGHALVLVWVLANILYWGQQMAKTMRYFLPIYPFLALLAAYGLLWLVASARAVAAAGAEHRGPDALGVLSRLRATRALAMLRVAARPLALLACVLVAGGTVFYGLAFSTIYERPVTRVAASAWIFDNLPLGSAFAWEHWDDPLPLRLPGRVIPIDGCEKGRNPAGFCSFQLPLYDDDNVAKRDKLISILNQTDYIFLSSNRLYGSIPRLPMRYPMTTEYYRLLFDGELGFRLEKEFTSYPSLLGITLNDDSSEEAFTVYDHPKVLIFKKTPEYSSARVTELLSRVDLSTVVRVRPTQAGTRGLLLDPSAWQRQQEAGTWSELFNRGSLANQVPVLAWLIALQIMTLAVFPIAWLLLRRLSDGGYLASKLLGLVIVSYLAWLFASVHAIEYGRPGILAGILLVGFVSAYLVRNRAVELAEFIAARGRLLLLEEGIFLAAFLGFLWIRAVNPDLWHPNFGGEKPMDYAYLNAVIKSVSFPPYDPWLAGGYINYYYFGQVLTATLVKLTGIVPWVSYNLAIPTYFALTAGLAFSFGHSLLAGAGQKNRWPPKVAVLTGLLAAGLVAVAGNMDALAQVTESLSKMGGIGLQSRLPGLAGLVNGLSGLPALLAGKPLPPLDFWRSTRVIGPEDPGPISEFPFFTFLYGDLHAHLIALPVTLCAILVGLAVVREGQMRELAPAWRPGDGARVLILGLLRSPWPWLLAVLSLLVGTLRATNTWDYPTYTALSAAAFALAHHRQERSINLAVLIWSGAAVIGLFALPSVLFQPYLSHFALFYTGVEPVRHTTALLQYLTIFGGFLILIGGFAAVESWRVVRRAAYAISPEPTKAAQQYHAGVAAPPWLEQAPAAALPSLVLLMFAAALSVTGRQTAACIAAALALIAFHIFRPRIAVELRYVWAMLGLALAVTLAPELVALKGDVGRMNTVFKFYLQAWVMLALVAAVSVPYVARRLRTLAGRASKFNRGWQWLVVLVLGSVAVYPLLATPVKLNLRFIQIPPTLDGMAYMQQAVYHDQGKPLSLAADYEAINWMLDNVKGTPVIVEAVTPLYHWGSRVAIYTGLPTVMGWDWHQKQQRGDFGYMVDERVQQVKTFFETPSIPIARQFLNRYGVRYIYVGPMERAFYPPQGLAKFDQMLDNGLSVAFRSSDVTIYQVDSP